MAEARATFEIVNKLGMHARAATKLVQMASRYRSEIQIEKDGHSANAKSVMGVLLFQDLAVVPMLALIPLLDAGSARETISLSSALIALAAFVALIAVGHYLLRPVFRVVASAAGFVGISRGPAASGKPYIKS